MFFQWNYFVITLHLSIPASADTQRWGQNINNIRGGTMFRIILWILSLLWKVFSNISLKKTSWRESERTKAGPFEKLNKSAKSCMWKLWRDNKLFLVLLPQLLDLSFGGKCGSNLIILRETCLSEVLYRQVLKKVYAFKL